MKGKGLGKGRGREGEREGERQEGGKRIGVRPKQWDTDVHVGIQFAQIPLAPSKNQISHTSIVIGQHIYSLAGCSLKTVRIY